MGIRDTSFSLGEFYHLYNRGVDKRPIFIDRNDQDRFIRLLYLSNSSAPIDYKMTKDLGIANIETGDKLVAIGAYCLMPNHFHLLVKEVKEGGTVKYMRKLLTAYSSYFNKKYERTGALFGSRFKSSHIDSDTYLKYIYAYIHLNPVKIIDPNWREKPRNMDLMKKFIERYQFSSYLDYSGLEREEGLILNKLEFPEYFKESGDFLREIESWLSTDLLQGRSLEIGG